jgi:iron complex outermembrane receptor protein
VEDDSLLQLRLGYIYTSEAWSYKTYLYRTQFALEPLMHYLDSSNYQNVKPQTTLGITQEISYTKKQQRVRLILHLMQDEDSLLQSRQNGLGGDTKYFTTIFNYDYTFDMNNKMYLQFYYAHYKDIFELDKLEDISGYLSFMNSYENFDFYNGLIWHKNSLDWKNYFDLTTSVSWNINEDFTMTLKGENLLNKAKETGLYRIDPATGTMLNPLSISPIDQRITIELEYMF